MSQTDYLGITAILILAILIIVEMRYLGVFSVRDANAYPTAYEVFKASDEQLSWWVWNLRAPENESEVDIIYLILKMYSEIENV